MNAIRNDFATHKIILDLTKWVQFDFQLILLNDWFSLDLDVLCIIYLSNLFSKID